MPVSELSDATATETIQLAEAITRLCNESDNDMAIMLALSSVLIAEGESLGMNHCCTLAHTIVWVAQIHGVSPGELVARIIADLAKQEKTTQEKR